MCFPSLLLPVLRCETQSGVCVAYPISQNDWILFAIVLSEFLPDSGYSVQLDTNIINNLPAKKQEKYSSSPFEVHVYTGGFFFRGNANNDNNSDTNQNVMKDC